MKLRRTSFATALHYLITSGTTGYFPNESQVATAPTYHGPWTLQGDPHPGDMFGTSYRSQVSCVFQHPTIDDLYIAMADRWLPWLPIEHSNVSNRSDSGFSTKEEAAAAFAAAPPQFTDPDTSIADYVWLPIRFDGDNAYLDWLDEWTPADYA